jgi:anion-transporting  ArsA/GET3 family ATPase
LRRVVNDGARLAAIVGAHEVVVVCGTGGVGKTTVSAALALSAALAGRRALVMTIDPAKRLAESLGIEARLNEPIRVDLSAAGAGPGAGTLDAMMLDARRTFDEVVTRFARDPDVRDRILSNPFYQRSAESLSGSQEYMAMERLLRAVHDGAWDLVVLDTPPTRNALDFIEAPERMIAVLQEGVLAWLSPRDGWSPLRAGLKLFGKGRETMFSVLERFLGGDVLRGIAEFVGSFGTLVEGFRLRAADVLALLRGERTAFVLVASPSRIALGEALWFHDRLREAGITLRGFVINRVKAPVADLGEPPRTPEEAGFSPAPDDPARSEALSAVFRHYRERARWLRVDRHHIDALRAHCGSTLPYVEIPELETEVHDVPALAALLPWLGASSG